MNLHLKHSIIILNAIYGRSFENINVQNGMPVSVEINDLYDKLINQIVVDSVTK